MRATLTSVPHRKTPFYNPKFSLITRYPQIWTFQQFIKFNLTFFSKWTTSVHHTVHPVLDVPISTASAGPRPCTTNFTSTQGVCILYNIIIWRRALIMTMSCHPVLGSPGDNVWHIHYYIYHTRVIVSAADLIMNGLRGSLIEVKL